MRETTITWRLDFNDADPIGWFTFAAYAVACVLCIAAARTARRSKPGPSDTGREEIRGWRCLGWFLLALGLNKELDLQVLLAQIGRRLAYQHGWYQYKTGIRVLFLLLLAGVGSYCAFKLHRATRGFWKHHPACLAGVLLLLAYAGARSFPWEQFSRRSAPRPADPEHAARPLWGIEVAGIACISAAAWKGRIPPVVRDAHGPLAG